LTVGVHPALRVLQFLDQPLNVLLGGHG
jgi:hypothetical protein